CVDDKRGGSELRSHHFQFGGIRKRCGDGGFDVHEKRENGDGESKSHSRNLPLRVPRWVRQSGCFVVCCEENPPPRRGSQVVRQRSAKPLFGGSIPPRASN